MDLNVLRLPTTVISSAWFRHRTPVSLYLVIGELASTSIANHYIRKWF